MTGSVAEKDKFLSDRLNGKLSAGNNRISYRSTEIFTSYYQLPVRVYNSQCRHSSGTAVRLRSDMGNRPH